MGCDGFGEGVEIVASFEGGDDAAVAVFVGEVDDQLGDPGEVVLCEVDVAEGIVGVGIEASGDEEDLRFELGDGGEPVALDGLAEGEAVGPGPEGSMDEVVAGEVEVAVWSGGVGNSRRRAPRECP